MNPAHPTPHSELNDVLEQLVAGVSAVLEDRLRGLWLIGSFAGGDHDAHSDVDFLAAVDEDLPLETLGALQDMHARIHAGDTAWSKRLDGSYVPTRILKRRDPAHTKLPYLDNGSRAFVASAHCNRLVIRWMVREQGLALVGSDARTLIDPIPVDEMREEVRLEMREWAEEMRELPDPVADPRYQSYAVLSFCRMLYTVETGRVASKPEAAAWARGALDARWRGLVERALTARSNPARHARERANATDVGPTHEFVAHALARVGA